MGVPDRLNLRHGRMHDRLRPAPRVENAGVYTGTHRRWTTEPDVHGEGQSGRQVPHRDGRGGLGTDTLIDRAVLIDIAAGA